MRIMRYIDWNIKCFCKIENIINLLDKKIQKQDCIVALQEVMPEKADALRAHFANDFTIVYSLAYRHPDPEFDTDNRRLGVMFLVSKDIIVKESGVFERCLFPERTLYVTLLREDNIVKVVTLHSITGVSFKMGKAVQFRSFAEGMRDYKPDIVSLDTNEPKVDHYDSEHMEFFDQGDKGKGAGLFFNEIKKQDLKDSYVENYNSNVYVQGEPLTTSHIINGSQHRRYDFVFVKNDMKVMSVDYLYDEAVAASSDHAMIVVEVKK